MENLQGHVLVRAHFSIDLIPFVRYAESHQRKKIVKKTKKNRQEILKKEEILACIENAKKGNQKAYELLLKAYWNVIYNYQKTRLKDLNEVEDITIQTFARAFDKINTYSSKYSFKNWLITISKNLQIDLYRKENKNNNTYIDEKENYIELKDESINTEDKLIKEQVFDKLFKSIKKLKSEYQIIIRLRYFEELSYIEISERLNESLSAVKIKLYRAKESLSKIMIIK